MGIVAVIVVIAACAVIVAAFFFTFFFVSFAGFGASVTGIEAALGDGSGDSGTEDTNPALLLALVLPVVLLVTLCVPPLRKKQGPFRLPVIGGIAIVVAIVALIVLFFAYSSTIGTLRRDFEGFDTYLAEMGETDFVTIGTGIGFKMAVIAHIVLLVMPFLDKCFRRKK
jgi:glucan phosphoethanolaminetransferase (alkaline phosphatase superfamily)